MPLVLYQVASYKNIAVPLVPYKVVSYKKRCSASGSLSSLSTLKCLINAPPRSQDFEKFWPEKGLRNFLCYISNVCDPISVQKFKTFSVNFAHF